MDGEPRAVALQVLKGGFGKSAIANALTDRLAKRGNRTLLMDLDPEGHLSTGLGYYERQNDDRPDYRDVVFEDAVPQDIIESTEWGFDIVPSLNLEAVNRDLSRDEVLRSDEQLKQHFVEPLLGDEYDYIVMDLAGSRNKLTNNAMVASRNIIIPLQPVAEALNGLRQTTTKMVGPLRQYMDVEILAVVPNRLSQRIDQDTTDRELLQSMNTSERFAAYLEAGQNDVDVDAAELPDDRSAEAVIDDHVPEFARITADDREWRNSVMPDDMFDLGDSADDEDNAGTDGNASNASNAETEGNDGSADNASGGDDEQQTADPQTTQAFDTEYRENQHTVAALDETWAEIDEVIEDAAFYFRKEGYSDLSKLERYEAFFQLAADQIDAEDIAERAKEQRHEAHGD